MIRMRHAPFAIGQVERDVWIQHMTEAVGAADCSPQDAALLLAYLDDTATFLMNR